MTPNPFLGLALITLGGLATASFYVPFKRVRGWTWETYWLVFGAVSWVIGPCVAAALTVPKLWQIIFDSPPLAVSLSFLFGALWGVGCLTNGLAIRYLGLSLGMAIPVGICAVLGTLAPPAMTGTLGDLVDRASGLVTLASIMVGIVGIVICTKAGLAKDRELSSDQKRESVSEFNLPRGLWLSVLAGIMSACMAFGIAAGKPIAESAVRHGANELWQNTPLFAVLLLGGFATNCAWCLFLSIRNRTAREFVQREGIPLWKNYYLCILAGGLWYLQFLFYGMGVTKLGRYNFAGWTVLMVCIIIFSNLWGLVFREWQGTSQKTKVWIVSGLLVLAISAVMTGYGNYLATFET